MIIAGMVGVEQTGVGPLLYIARSDEATISVIDLDASDNEMSEGAYTQTFIGDDPQARKRGKRLIVTGRGRNVTATLTVTMDDERTLQFALKGPYDVNQSTLFLMEFDPAVVTGRWFTVTLSDVSGTKVRIRDMDFRYSRID